MRALVLYYAGHKGVRLNRWQRLRLRLWCWWWGRCYPWYQPSWVSRFEQARLLRSARQCADFEDAQRGGL